MRPKTHADVLGPYPSMAKRTPESIAKKPDRLPKNQKGFDTLACGPATSTNPGGTQRIYIDHGFPGLGLRVGPRARMWIYTSRIKGKSTRVTLGALETMTLAEARAVADLIKRQIKSGVDIVAEREAEKRCAANASLTFEEAVRQHLVAEEHRVKPATWAGKKIVLNRSDLAPWRNRQLKDITRADVLKITDALRAAKKIPMAISVEEKLAVFFDDAIDRGLIEENPARSKVRRRRGSSSKPRSRDRVLSAGEIEKLLLGLKSAPISPVIATILTLVLLTAQRPGEVRGMRWKELDLDAALWTIPAERYKTNKPHEVPLSHWVVNMIRRIESEVNPGEFVFGGRREIHSGSISGALRNWFRARKDLKHHTAHDLRRTARTFLTERLDVSFETAERVVGHAVGSTVAQTYDRGTYLEQKRVALQAWSDYVQSLIMFG